MALEEMVLSMKTKSAIEKPGFYSRMFVVPKATGDDFEELYSHQPRRLDGLYRLQGYLRSGPHTQEVQKIPEICMGRHRLPVTGNSHHPRCSPE